MASYTLVRTGFYAGRWEGLLTGETTAATPKIVARHQGTTLGGLILSAGQQKGEWKAIFDVPLHFLSEGVQTILFVEETAQDTLDSFTILSGDVLSDDIRAEHQLLRDELEMLKRAFRRHCNETR